MESECPEVSESEWLKDGGKSRLGRSPSTPMRPFALQIPSQGKQRSNSTPPLSNMNTRSGANQPSGGESRATAGPATITESRTNSSEETSTQVLAEAAVSAADAIARLGDLFQEAASQTPEEVLEKLSSGPADPSFEDPMTNSSVTDKTNNSDANGLLQGAPLARVGASIDSQSENRLLPSDVDSTENLKIETPQHRRLV